MISFTQRSEREREREIIVFENIIFLIHLIPLNLGFDIKWSKQYFNRNLSSILHTYIYLTQDVHFRKLN